jgi:hypothetical protein
MSILAARRSEAKFVHTWNSPVHHSDRFQHVRFQPQSRRASPKQLTLTAHSLAPRASRHLQLPVPADIFLIKEELEVPYEIKFYQRDSNQLAPKELLNVNPLGKAPVITDGDVTLAESGAIIRA